MADYTLVNLQDIEDMAPKFGHSPGLSARGARQPLEMQNSGLGLYRLGPSFRTPFGHRHETQEEVYVVLDGSARIKIEDEVIDLHQWDAIRVAAGLAHCIEGGPEGAQYLAFGAPNTNNGDIEMLQGWWKD
jgi:mannose-6-phosphate isomerase-like protein (cupin superfamily)